MPGTLDDYMASDAGLQLQQDLASLSDAQQAQVMQHLQDAADTGGLDGLNTDQLILDAQTASDHRADAEQDLAQQAQAADAGDWSTAQEFAQKAEGEMQDVQDHGGTVDSSQVIQAQHDDANLGWAEYHQEIADDNATTATAYAETGDMAHAEQYGDIAASQADTAAGYGATADVGGVYGDHSVDAGATADATASTVDTSSHVDTSPAVDTSTATE